MEVEILELFELHYADLLALSSPKASSEELDSITRTVLETLGPSGPGLLAITGVPEASKLRRELLPLARKLALLNHENRKRILKEHNLGSDVPLRSPDRSVSSFAMQLRYVRDAESTQNLASYGLNKPLGPTQDHLGINGARDCYSEEFRSLGNVFKGLGFCMMDIGLQLAKICDRAIGGCELEQSLLESCSAKGRLIHYHSALDSLFLKEAGKSKGTAKRQPAIKRNQVYSNGHTLQEGLGRNDDVHSSGIHSNLWQQWHYDYGIFTVLTAPMFLLPSHLSATEMEDVHCAEEYPSPDGHTYLHVYHPNKNNVFLVKAPPESFVIQVGESADILSKGKLRSTLHCVYKPEKFPNLSREIFVVFLQPAWNKTFSISDYHPEEDSTFSGQQSEGSDKETSRESICYKLGHEIQKTVPPLSSRLKDGMTFAEFSRETTKQYYGGSGLQSNG